MLALRKCESKVREPEKLIAKTRISNGSIIHRGSFSRFFFWGILRDSHVQKLFYYHMIKISIATWDDKLLWRISHFYCTILRLFPNHLKLRIHNCSIYCEPGSWWWLYDSMKLVLKRWIVDLQWEILWYIKYVPINVNNNVYNKQ